MPLSIHEEFPLTEKVSYLNTAGMGLVPRSVIDSTCDLYRRHLTEVPYPDMFDEFGAEVERARGVFARWINARPEEVSFQSNASTSLNFVASMLDPKRGENVVVDDLGFPSGTFPMLNLQKKGVEVRWVKNHDGGLITASDYESAIDDRTRLVMVSLVSWVNGLRAEVEEITKLAHERGARCAVDSTHATGYVEIDAKGWGLDFLASSNYKWLLSTHGASEFFCASRLLEELDPPQFGWHTAGGKQKLTAEKLEVDQTARKFEPGNPDYISIFTLVKSLGVLSRYGKRRVTSQTLKLSRMINEGLRSLGMEVLTPLDKEHVSGIVFARSGRIQGEDLAAKLRRSGVLVTPRTYHGRSGIRVSPYFYNDEADVEMLLEKTKSILRRR